MVFYFFLYILTSISENDYYIHKIEGGHSISIPITVSVKMSNPVEDFLLYKFSLKEEKTILTLYIGNQPNLRDGPITSFNLVDKSSLVKTIDWIDKEGLFNGDILFKLNDNNYWPLYAHFNYRKINMSEKETVDKIIGGLNINRE